MTDSPSEKVVLYFWILLFIIFISVGVMQIFIYPNQSKSLDTNITYNVVSVQQVRKDTIFTHHYDIRFGYIDSGKLRFTDTEMDSILYSNDTKLILSNHGWGSHEYIFYWNGIEVK